MGQARQTVAVNPLSTNKIVPLSTNKTVTVTVTVTVTFLAQTKMSWRSLLTSQYSR